MAAACQVEPSAPPMTSYDDVTRHVTSSRAGAPETTTAVSMAAPLCRRCGAVVPGLGDRGADSDVAPPSYEQSQQLATERR